MIRRSSGSIAVHGEQYVNGTSGRIRSAKTVLSPDGSHRQRRYITCFRCPAAGRTMKKTSVRSAVPVTTRDTSHSVTDDGTVGLCHTDPQGEVKSLKMNKCAPGPSPHIEKVRFQKGKRKESSVCQQNLIIREGGAVPDRVLGERKNPLQTRWQQAILEADRSWY